MGFTRLFRLWGAVVAMLATMSLPAVGHEERRADVAVELDALPSALQGINISVHRTLAHQLVVENRTSQQLEVIGASGRSFLRIGPDGVDADLASREWYQTYTAVGIPLPAAAQDGGAAPRWATVRRAPAWGWFDLRLRTDRVSVPHDVAHGGRTARIGRFSIPVRIGSEVTEVTGTFRYTPAPAGYFAARLLGSGDIAPGVRLHVLAGTPPGLYLENAHAEPVTVLGALGEPFVRIGPEGVHVNLRSPSWLASGQAELGATDTTPDASAPPVWQRRSPSPRFAWVEPRLGHPRSEPPDAVLAKAGPREIHAWEIAVLHGGARKKIVGAIDWIPIDPTRPTAAR